MPKYGAKSAHLQYCFKMNNKNYKMEFEKLICLFFRDLLPSSNSRVQLVEGSPNNTPDAAANEAANQIAQMAKKMDKSDILLTLISGQSSIFGMKKFLPL